MLMDPNQAAAPMTPPVAPQQNTPAPVAQPDVSSADMTGQGTPAIATDTSKPALPKGTQINTDPNAGGSAEPSHGTLGNVFQALAGGKKISYKQTPDGPVPVHENLAPGEIARNILASALVGLSGGYSKEARGGGPGAAFSAGFEAEQQRTDQQQKQAQQQAQEQFKNQQTTDELTLRKMQNAREQQRSIQEAQEHSLRMDQLRQNIEQGKTEGAEHIVEFQQKQADRVNLLSQLGAKPLQYPDGKPVEEFNSPAEAMDWANKNSALAIQKGKYNTIVEVDPHTNRYMIMQKPMSWDDPQWLGVKTENGVPIRDKDGNFVPDGTFKDFNGKVVAPAGQMTPRQMYDSQIRLIEMQDKKLTLQESLERLKTSRMARAKDEQQMKADDEFNRAGGNPDAIDPKTHQFILSPSSRTILQQRYIKEYAAAGVILKAAQKQLEQTPAEDKQAYADTLDEVNSANALLRQNQVNLLTLSRTPNVADVIADNIRKENTKPDGTFDQEAAVKALDSMQMNSGVKQTARQKLTAAPPNVLDDPNNFNKAITAAQGMLKGGQTLEGVVADINAATTLSKTDKQRLIEAVTNQVQQAASGNKTLHDVLAQTPVVSPVAPPAAMQGMTR